MDKCAPSKKFKDGSCFTLDNLQEIAMQYNKIYDDIIEIVDDKKALLRELNSKMKSRYNCSEQTCWLESKVVKSLNNNDIKHYTFRPKGPKKQYEWLSTNDINSVMSQYMMKHKDFKYLGALPYDFEELEYTGIDNINLKELESKTPKIGMVINLDEHDQPGSHWVALYTNLKNNKVYYFDSFGKKPGKRVTKFIRKILTHMYNKKYNTNFNVDQFMNKYHKSDEYDVRYNKKQHQFKNTECGVYSMNFIIRLLDNENFDMIVDNITKDDMMNACRKQYFRNNFH
jgi:hypothetical protein